MYNKKMKKITFFILTVLCANNISQWGDFA